MTEEFLDRHQVGTGIQQVRRKGVPKRVYRKPLTGGRLGHQVPYDALDGSSGESSSSWIEQERRAIARWLPEEHLQPARLIPIEGA